MTTVYVRFGGGDIEDDTTPVVPTLAALLDRIISRPSWEVSSPLTVDGPTFARANSEMTQVRAKQGYSYTLSADLPQRNFLLYGVPIVCGD